MRDTLLAFAREADVVLPGLAEGRFLTGETAPEAIAEAFLKMGARAAVVKTGPAAPMPPPARVVFSARPIGWTGL